MGIKSGIDRLGRPVGDKTLYCPKTSSIRHFQEGPNFKISGSCSDNTLLVFLNLLRKVFWLTELRILEFSFFPLSTHLTQKWFDFMYTTRLVCYLDQDEIPRRPKIRTKIITSFCPFTTKPQGVPPKPRPWFDIFEVPKKGISLLNLTVNGWGFIYGFSWLLSMSLFGTTYLQ